MATRTSPTGSHAAERPRSRLRLGLIAAAGVVVLAVAAFLLLGGDAPSEVAIDDAVAGLQDDAGSRGSPVETDAGDPTGADATSADGSWTVSTDVEPYDLATSSGSFVGYRIDEELANIGATQAVGRTPAVSGGLTVEGTTVHDAVVEGDLSRLASDRPQRDGRVATALEVERDPTVRFTADDFELPRKLEDGDRVEVDVPGTLEAVGGSTEVVATVTAERAGEVVVLTGSSEVALADLGVTPPTAALVLSVADTATIEWQLYLTRS